jgi:glycosyltransferase involved in cell wall biosynthesis
MKILIVSEFFPKSSHCEIRGGVEARAFYIARELAKTHKVSVITSLEKGQKKEANFSNISVYRVGSPREYAQLGSFKHRLIFIKNAIKKGSKINADVVDGYNFISYIAAHRIARKRKMKSVATYHDVWLKEWIANVGFASGFAGELTERYILTRKWDKFIAVSQYTRHKLIKAGINPRLVSVVHNGVDLNEIRRIKVRKHQKPTISCVSRLVKYKRIDTLIHAVGLIKRKIPDVQCNIIGTGPEKYNLLNLIKHLHLESNVKLLGFVPNHKDVLKEIKRSHVFCLASSVEGFGMTVVEAMACQVPFVATEIIPVLEVTDFGKGGMVFRIGHYKELAAKLTILLQDKKLQLEKQSEMDYIERYDWKNISRQVEAIYSNIK